MDNQLENELNHEYLKLYNVIIQLQNHINIIKNKFIITITEYSFYIDNINKISTNLDEMFFKIKNNNIKTIIYNKNELSSVNDADIIYDKKNITKNTLFIPVPKKKFVNYFKNNQFECFNNKLFIDIKASIKHRIMEMGYINLLESLKLIYYKYNFNLLINNELLEYILIYNTIFHPVLFYYDNTLKYSENITICKMSKKSSFKINSLFLKNNGADIIFKIDGKYLVCIGYFNIDNNYFTKKSIMPLYYNFSFKYDIIEIKILKELDTIPLWFREKYLKYLGFRKIVSYTEDEIYDDIKSKYSFYKKIIAKPINKSIDYFVNSDIEQMVNILNILYYNEKKHDFVIFLIDITKNKKIETHCLYNLILNSIEPYIDYSSKNIINCFDSIKKITYNNLSFKEKLKVNHDIPSDIKEQLEEKIQDLKPSNNDYFKQKLFIDTLINYPWAYPSKITDNNNKYFIDIKNKINNKIYGHNESKKILFRILGKWLVSKTNTGVVIGLHGPPGVGKTHFAKTIGEILDIPFIQINLGGHNDVEYLIGHGYTYSSAQPGIIVKELSKKTTSRCILFFDELDKISSKNNSNEISGVLIHLTDPESNKEFQDRFFQGINFDISNCLIMFSYNDATKIDPILLDRMNKIKAPEYTLNDKLQLSKKYFIPELVDELNLNKINIELSDSVIEYIIYKYTNEAGVRELKRLLSKLLLQINVDYIENKIKDKVIITEANISNYLGITKINIQKINNVSNIGIINGLYATSGGHGGIILIQIKPNVISKNFEIKCTGSQGNVMKESAYVSYNIAQNIMKNESPDWTPNEYGYHFHAPDGGTPKDGPSAGSAITLCFLSVFKNKHIKNNVAITGEIDLCGKVSKIGGVNLKIKGAIMAGVDTIIFPKENESDVTELIKNDNTIDNMNFVFVEHIKDTFQHIFIDP